VSAYPRLAAARPLPRLPPTPVRSPREITAVHPDNYVCIFRVPFMEIKIFWILFAEITIVR
jgi:hypothetical protein